MSSPASAADEPSADEIAGQVMAELLARSHLMRPAGVAEALARAARPLGVSGVQVYLADLQQRHLVPLAAADGRAPEVLLIDSTLAGRAYQTVTVQSGRPGPDGQLWIPLVDGTERLGVLGLTVSGLSEAMLARYQTLASLAGMMIASKTGYSDTYAQVQRTREMSLQAELVWAFLPPRTFATTGVLVCATLEPAYEAGGDAFDYSLLGDHLHVSIFDALVPQHPPGGRLADQHHGPGRPRHRQAVRQQPVRHRPAVRPRPGHRAAPVDSLRSPAAAAHPREPDRQGA
jgi:hypothetical protein